MGGGIELAPLKTKIQVDIDGFKKNMQEAADVGVKEAERISKKMSLAAKAGENLSKTGSLLTKGLTAPIMGASAMSAKMAVDFETSFAKVSTLLDENRVDFARYKEQLLQGSNETKVAVDEYSEAVYASISAGVDQTEAIQFTTEAMKLAKGGFTSGAKAVDVLTTAINAYGLKAGDAVRVSDLLITTQNLGKTTVDELASSMGTVIPVANASNFSIEELSASYALLTKNGVATAESGTYLKAMLSELSKSGSITDKTLRELTGKGFADLKKDGVATTEILGILNDEAQKNDKTLKDMFGSVEAGSAALVLYKNSGTEYTDMLESMKKSAGETQKAFEKMDATPAEKLKGSLNELRNAGVKFGASFVPVITKASDVLTDAADVFSNLSEEQQENVIQWGAVLAAVGPITKVTGGTISTFTKLSSVMKGTTAALGVAGGSSGVIGGFIGLLGTCAPVAAGLATVGGGIYAVHENSQLMNRTVIESREEMSLMERVMAKLQGVEVKSKEELEALGLVHKDFGENISPEFQNAVKKSTDKLQELGIKIREIGFDDVITEEESRQFDVEITSLCDEAISTIQGKKEEAQAALKELFVADDQLIDEGEQKVLEILSESSDKQIEEVTMLKEEIYKIKQKAVEEGRALNEQEISDIEKKTERIKQIELESIGKTQEEIEYAKNEFSARVETMDAKAASKLLKQKSKQREEEIIQIKAAYDTQIEMLNTKMEDCTFAEKQALYEQVKNLEKDKKEKIKLQNELWDEYLDIVNEKNPELRNTINRYNGQILKNEDKKSQEMLREMMDTYDGLNQITESGCYQIYNKNLGMWQNMRITVDENTGAITGIFNESTGQWAGYTQKMAEDARNMAVSQKGSYEMIGASMGMYIGKAGQIMNANGEVVGSLDDLKVHTDGTRRGILDLNGTPYEIKVNKDGTISTLEAVNAAADRAARDRYMTIHVSSNNPSIAAYNGVKTGDGYRWHFNGLDNVPYDGYKALLHKGERVLTAEENKAYSNVQQVDYKAIRTIVRGEIGAIKIVLNDRELGRIVRKYR